jgi:hypothetical protein
MPGLVIGMEEGVGAALASGLVRTALAIHRDGLRAQAEAAPSRH